MKKSLYFMFVIISIILIISCDTKPGYIPDEGPKNIKFTPSSGKPGDIITITGDDFYPIEKMLKYKEFYDSKNYLYEEHIGLVLFNVNIYYNPETKIDLIFEGSEVVDFIEFDTNKIICKVPEGAKSGKIWVNGIYNATAIKLHHPSEEEFIVYDESGDEVR